MIKRLDLQRKSIIMNTRVFSQFKLCCLLLVTLLRKEALCDAFTLEDVYLLLEKVTLVLTQKGYTFKGDSVEVDTNNTSNGTARTTTETNITNAGSLNTTQNTNNISASSIAISNITLNNYTNVTETIFNQTIETTGVNSNTTVNVTTNTDELTPFECPEAYQLSFFCQTNWDPYVCFEGKCIYSNYCEANSTGLIDVDNECYQKCLNPTLLYPNPCENYVSEEPFGFYTCNEDCLYMNLCEVELAGFNATTDCIFA